MKPCEGSSPAFKSSSCGFDGSDAISISEHKTSAKVANGTMDRDRQEVELCTAFTLARRPFGGRT